MVLQSLQHALGFLEHHDSWKARRRFQKLLLQWAEVVGSAVATQAQPLYIQRRVLYVATSSAAWSQTLMFERQRILAKLNASLSASDSLTDIRFSTAQWQCDRPAAGAMETEHLWYQHPSRLPKPAAGQPLSRPESNDPQTAFQGWAKAVQAQTKNLPLCPQCQCPTPEGELKRWSVCSLCVPKQW
ncbi:DUF721 domain-containing protein [Oculatella sp. LEGE 06141]|uniref:DUF721 domain-containing protein n=1 Tax=Oculatella sp. LEGE 06141 TaxID=1828648 RepID=UPI00187E35B4|nr:DciA family protein [Oculatella sp. LEGE 06141]MBE9179919.1 DUF721 domain-containing protein [Oculatella sp. LEGE 06141]